MASETEIRKQEKPPSVAPEMRAQSQPATKRSDSNAKLKGIFGAAVVIAVALAVCFGIWSLSRRLVPQMITAPAPAARDTAPLVPAKSIAVLPFEDLSEDKENAFLAAGVQDDILTALSKLVDLKVISRTSVNTYPVGVARDLHEIGQALGVSYVLEGSVRRSGEKVQVTALLLDVSDSSPVWKQSYDRDLSEIFAVQSEIVGQIAPHLHAQFSETDKAAIEQRPTKDLIAYGLYVRAKELIATISFNSQINDKLLKAVQLLDQSIARDPDFFLAYCQLSAAHNYLYFFGYDHTPARLALADSALKSVTRLRPDAGETHLAQADFFYRCYLDYDKARAELALAQRTLPNNSEIFELTGYIDRRQGLWNESARSLQKALQLDPRNFFMLQQIATSYQEFRQFGAMAAALDRALTLVPRDLDTRVTRALVELEWKADTNPLHKTVHAILAEDSTKAVDLADQWLYLSLCERDTAAVADALASISPDGISTDLNFPRSWCQALAARARGDAPTAEAAFTAARAEVERTVREQPEYGPSLCVLGLIDAGLGRKEEAIREGRHAVELLPLTKDSIDGAELMKFLAVIYAWTGEKDLAIDQIAATLRIPSSLSYGNLKLHPYWDALRGNPRFEKIVADLAPKNVEE